MIRLALVGCGEHSWASHAKPLARFAAAYPEKISLAAACDKNLERAEQFRREFGFAAAYSDLDELLENETIDACVTVMPIELIGETAAKLLQKGVACTIEKPLGSSLPEIERLAQIAHETGTPHLVSVNRRFFPFLNRALEWARERGQIQYVRAAMIRQQRREPDFIWSTAIHAVDAARHIAGEIKNFDFTVIKNSALSANWYNISIQFQNNVTALIEILPTAGTIEETYEFFGENFRARVVADGSGTQRSLHCWTNGKLEIEEFAEEKDEDINNGGYAEICEFVEALQTGRAPAPNVSDILPSARLCLTIAERINSENSAQSVELSPENL